MKINKTETLFLISLVVLMAIGGALAQAPKTGHASIPFEFWVAGNRFAAGDYVIEQLESTSYLYIRSADGRTMHDVYTLPVDDVPAKNDDCKLIFEVRNGTHYLYGGWGPFGQRVVTTEYTHPAPSGVDRAEVPIIFR